MIIRIILFFLLLLALFFLSHKISTSIYESIFIITKSRKLAVGILVVLLLPGTIIHELSHFIVATILRVPTGELSVIPTVENNEIKAGGLFLGQTDPFRLSLVGLSPIIVGLFLIYLAGKSFPFTPGVRQLADQPPQGWFAALPIFVIFYLLFTISITMFSSKKDAESLKIAIPIILLLFISLYLIGIRIRVFFEGDLLNKIAAVLSDLNYYLFITSVINGFILFALYGNLYFWKRILKIRIKQ